MNLAAFNWLDWAIIGLILLSTIVGVIRGFVREGLSLVVWILAFWLAFSFANYVADHWIGQAHVHNDSLRYGLSFAAIFLATLIIGGFINFLIGTAVQKTGLGGTDRIMGLIFGFIRGALIIAVLLLFINLTPAVKENWFKQAQTPQHFSWLVNWIHGLIPENFKKYLKASSDETSESVTGTTDVDAATQSGTSNTKANPAAKTNSSTNTDASTNATTH